MFARDNLFVSLNVNCCIGRMEFLRGELIPTVSRPYCVILATTFLTCSAVASFDITTIISYSTDFSTDLFTFRRLAGCC